MTAAFGHPHSVWTEFELPSFPALDQSLEVEVVVVGAGIAGVTTAYLLRKAGIRVALLERSRIASGDTSRTTAHLTYVTDQRLSELVSRFGKDAARAFWEGGAAAIDEIWRINQETRADANFSWVPGFLHAPADGQSEEDRESLQQDAALARELGFDAQFFEKIPLLDRSGVRFAHQALFHPRKYLAALVSAIPGEGSHVFEQTEFHEFDASSGRVSAGKHSIRCNAVVVATHNPRASGGSALSAALFQTKLSLYTSYVVGAKLRAGTAPPGLFWDTNDPYEYLRIENRPEGQYAILGGKDVKTGQEKAPEDIQAALKRRLEARLPGADVQHRWLGQVIETADGLPFIGEGNDHQFIATGFAGNGMTLGTLSAMMARDWYLDRANPWSGLFRPDRRPLDGGLWRYVTENVDYPYYMIRDRVARGAGKDPRDLAPGEGAILNWRGDKVAAFRDERGALSVCSPVCTHLKCLVHWNAADRTWDCPCHGSRFDPQGRVLSGPAERPLEPIPFDAG